MIRSFLNLSRTEKIDKMLLTTWSLPLIHILLEVSLITLTFCEILSHIQGFLKGDISTNFIPQEYPNGYQGHVLTDTEFDQLIALAASIHHLRVYCDQKIGIQDPNMNGDYVILFGGKTITIGISSEIPKLYAVSLSENEEPIAVDLRDYQTDDFIIPCKFGGASEITRIAQLFKIRDLGYDIQFCGSVYSIDILSPIEAELHQHMVTHEDSLKENAILSPMAGTLISVAVKPGDKVVVGQEIAVVEAMKMQNMLRATKDGIVKTVKGTVGKPLQLDEVIVELEAVTQQKDDDKK